MDKHDMEMLARSEMITKMALELAAKMAKRDVFPDIAANLRPNIMYKCKLSDGEIQFIYIR